MLEKYNNLSDLKKYNTEELKELAKDIRDVIIKKIQVTSGHCGPNLAFVEATIAMHYVFNSPIDKIVYDVSHQSYPHKILTGRKEGFTDENQYYSITGYSNPKESEHDIFQLGHTSVGVSLGFGLAKARDLKNEKYNIISVIGDGSLSGGVAFEGLNNAGELKSNFIIVVNDNEMSIAENHGGLYKNLAELRKTNGKATNNIFKCLNLDYMYVEEGNNIEELIKAFEKVKDIDHPIIVHLHTIKGMGWDIAMQHKERFHYIFKNTVSDVLNNTPPSKDTYQYTANQIFIERKDKKDNILVVDAGCPGVGGLNKEIRNKLGKNYLDVGIAEQHALSTITGAAKNGIKPVFLVYTSFLQRAYDQLIHDLAINNIPATIIVYAGGIYPTDATHLGIFDITLVNNIPNIVLLSPTNKEEYENMINYSLDQNKHPTIIRAPLNYVTTGNKDNTDYSKINKYQEINKGSKVALIGAGDYFHLAKEVKEKLSSQNINATLINPKFLSGVDVELLNNLKTNHELIITLESGIISGGFGEKITRFYGTSNLKVLNYGAKKEFYEFKSMNEIIERYHLNSDLIIKDIINTIK